MAKKNKQAKAQAKAQKKAKKQKKKQIKQTYRNEKRAAKKKKKYDLKQLKSQTNYTAQMPVISEPDTLTTSETVKKNKKTLAERFNNVKNFVTNNYDKINQAKDKVMQAKDKVMQAKEFVEKNINNNQKIDFDDMSDTSRTIDTNSDKSTTNTTNNESFFSKYKVPLIIGGALLAIGGVVFALTKSGDGTKLNGIDDDDDLGDIEPIDLS